MNQFEYQIIPLSFKSVMTGKVDIAKLEAELNHAAEKGYRLKFISGISTNWNSYLEKQITSEQETYQYRIFDSDYQSKITGKISRAGSSQFLTGFGLEGWQLKMVHTFTSKTYFFLEKQVNKS